MGCPTPLSGPFAAGRAAAWRPAGPWFAVAAIGLLAVAVRLPFTDVGLVPDEGGYAYVASAWADGARLYHDAWVDRPQALVLAYRALVELHDGALAIRLGAAGAGAAVAVLLLAVGWLVHSPAAGIWSASLYAVVGVAARLEGYTLHAELAAAVPATAAIVAALLWRRSGRAWLLALAGALGGAGVLMKQSGFDGLVVALVIAAGGAAGRGGALQAARVGARRGGALRPGRVARLHGAALVAAGAAAVIGLAALHGALLGWAEYWNAVVGYRLGAGPSVTERLTALGRSLDLAARDLLPLALLAAVGAARCAGRHRRDAVPLVWLAAALAGFHVGGAYWAHYYVQLIAPLSLLAGIAAAELPRPALRAAAAAAAVAPVAVLLAQLAVAGDRHGAIPSRPPADRDERVARYLRRQAPPHESVFVLVSRPNVYHLARRRPPTRYLWHPPLARIPGAMRALRRRLSGPRRPAYVVVYQPPARADPSGALGRLVAAHYVRDPDAPPGLPPILRRRD